MASLDTCAPEIIETIVQQLDLASILNLRLCSRSLSVNVAQGTWKSFYRSRRVLLNTTGLEDFVRFAACQRVSQYLVKLVLIGEVIDLSPLGYILEWGENRDGQKYTPEDLERVAQRFDVLRAIREDRNLPQSPVLHTRLLTTAFELLGRNGRLPSLYLDVEVTGEDEETKQTPGEAGEWKAIWEAASNTWNIAITALVRSRLVVEELDVFYQPMRCSLDCRQLRLDGLDAEDVKKSFSTVTSLAMSLSETLLSKSVSETLDIQRSREYPETLIAFHTGEDILCGVSSFFSALPSSLNELKLHWTNLLQTIRNTHTYTVVCSTLFDRIVKAASQLQLDSLELRGFHLENETSLLDFLQRVDPKRLRLTRIALKSGSYETVFNHLVSDDCRLEYVYLYVLLDHERRLLWFDETVRPASPATSLQTAWAPNHIVNVERNGVGAKAPIGYSFPLQGEGWLRNLMPGERRPRHAREKLTREMRNRRAAWMVEYGPPNYRPDEYFR